MVYSYYRQKSKDLLILLEKGGDKIGQKVETKGKVEKSPLRKELRHLLEKDYPGPNFISGQFNLPRKCLGGQENGYPNIFSVTLTPENRGKKKDGKGTAYTI